MISRTSLLPLVLLATAACGFSPVSRSFELGEDELIVFTAKGRGNSIDLFAVPPTGGEPIQFTFTTLGESLPRLGASGVQVAFVRDRGRQPGEDLVVMNLLNGAERILELPPEAGAIETIGWSSDEAAIYVQTERGRWRVTAPPAGLEVSLVSPEDAIADSALMVLLGRPAFARAEICEDGGVCVVGSDGEPIRLDSAGAAPFRWGDDAVGWIADGRIRMRSLGPGAPRRVDWPDTSIKAIEASYSAP